MKSYQSNVIWENFVNTCDCLFVY